MEKQFVTYDLALKLKELGFDEEALAYYDTHTKECYLNDVNEKMMKSIESTLILLKAPLWQQAFDWCGENYFLEGSFDTCSKTSSNWVIWDGGEDIRDGVSDTRYGTKVDCLTALLDIVEATIELAKEGDAHRLILKAYSEGKTIQSNHSGEWNDFVPQNQVDKPNLDYGTIDNWRIKP